MPATTAAKSATSVPAPRGEETDPLPRIDDPGSVSPADARELSKLFFDRLRELEEGTHEYQYARNTLIELSMPLVHFAVRRFGPRGQDEEVVQVGVIGLIKAIDRFDLSRETEFSTFAIPYIQGEIRRFFRDTTWAVHVPRRLQEMRLALARARETLVARLDREPSVAELAGFLECTEEEVRDGLVAANGYTTDSLDMPLDSGSPRTAGDSLADHLGSHDPAIELVEDLHSLAPLLARLDERDRRILELRFGQEYTQAQIAEVFGLSQMHVSRLLSRILSTLRAGLLADR